ncbi:hypothetical protein [Psychroserpens sp. SPM9]|uniref:hypothetical protein n=1 Tax=Psychroserpens sp. SPM9 TaxID=2975598 RepID=UPI0021A39DF7|nr:hypothetical protein [Psychroserpens sp. SPM9]MDG5490117.1 hypothetical protein [Psychroserpens sp. SPM9]
MKTSIYTLISISIFTLSCLSCSSDDPEVAANEPRLTNYIYKTYNVSNTPNTVLDSTNYSIEDNKIVSASGLNLETSFQRNSTYTYLDDKIDKIQSFSNGLLTRVQSFTYDANDDLIAYLSESIDTDNQSSSFEKHEFTHTTDTIFSSTTRSSDGINFDTNVSEAKIVLDANNNRTYYEMYSHFNEETTFEINTYDANSNLINEAKYLILDNGNEVLSFENNVATNNSENLFYSINETTFTRKNLMLLYHLQSNAVNTINGKSITPNAIITFASTWGNSFATFEILNTTNDTGLTIYSDFKTTIAGNLISRFSQDYSIQY